MSDEDKLPVGKVIRALRVSGGMTQQQFGSLVGLRQQRIWELESDKYSPTLPILMRISNATGVPLWKIIRKSQRIQEHFQTCTNSDAKL